MIVALGPTLLVALAYACGAPRLPAPPYVRQPTNALAEVPYPPPPARVERVPEPPGGAAVWIDGEWSWQGRRWAWKRGRWVVPPPGAAFAPWTAVRDASGTLYFAPGTWRDAKGAEVPEPEPAAHAKPSRGGVVNAEGEDVPPSPIARPTAGPTSATTAPPVPVAPQTGAVELDASPADAAADVDLPDGFAPPDAMPLEPDAARMSTP